MALAVLRRDLGETHGAAMADVGVGEIAGLRPEDFFEDEDIAGLEIGEAAE